MSVSHPVKNPYELEIIHLKVQADVLSFEGKEHLSQPFHYRIQFTSPVPRTTPGVFQADSDESPASALDIDATSVLNRRASFALYGPPPPRYPWEEPPREHLPLRKLYGAISAFRRLGGSHEQGHYEVILQPRFAHLERGKQYRLYRNQSVPEIVRYILTQRHGLLPHEFEFKLVREYPRRPHVMQYGENDLSFINRLLAEVGIWYRIDADLKLNIDVVRFHDAPCHFQFDVKLPLLWPSGFSSGGADGAWNLRTHHQVVEKNQFFRSYDHRQAQKELQDEIEQHHLIVATTYGERYDYNEPYTELGDRYAHRGEAEVESGHFFANLRRERILNQRSRLLGSSSSPTLAPGQVLEIEGPVPQDFANRVAITTITTRAARNASFSVEFEGIPYSHFICFRPPYLAKPQISGTLPARITSKNPYDRYSHLDEDGCYRVSFLFDRDERKAGFESLPMRLARPYAGDKYGSHFPLLAGTEVAVAFVEGDPDRPYIAHALHDSRHPDHVTQDNFHRNVLRTPSNNKLRMEDKTGEEHVKLSTEFAGKSQLNLGHLVDRERRKRGEGFELRTDHWGVLRAGKGLRISAHAQPGAEGEVLEMGSTLGLLQQAAEQLEHLSNDAGSCRAESADVQAQIDLFKQDLAQLKSAVLLLSAPEGIAATSGTHLQLAARDNLMLNAGGHGDVSVIKRLFIGAGQGLSLFVRKLGIKLIANQGPVQVQAQNDRLLLMARQGLEITSTEDEIRISAGKKITRNAGGSYLILDPCRGEAGTEGDYLVKAPYVYFTGKTKMTLDLPALPVLTDYEKKGSYQSDHSG